MSHEVKGSPEINQPLHSHASHLTSSVQMTATTVSTSHKLSKNARKKAKKKAKKLALSGDSGGGFVFGDDEDHHEYSDDQDDHRRDNESEHDGRMDDDYDDNSDNDIFDASSIRTGVTSPYRGMMEYVGNSNVLAVDGSKKRRDSNSSTGGFMMRVDDDGFQIPSDDEF